MKLLFRTSAFAALLLAIVVLNAAVAAAQDAGTPGPPATTTSGGSVESSTGIEEADELQSWSGLGWPTMAGSMALGSFWAYRRFQAGLVKASLAKFTSGGEQWPLDAVPLAQSSLGGLPSGALLLVLTTSMSFGIIALFDYPSQISNLHPWIDVVPLVWFLVGPFLIGLLSESRGVGAIPILGYVLGLLLWHSTPGENINTLSYDIGWLGFLLLPVGIPGLMLYLLFRFGRALR